MLNFDDNYFYKLLNLNDHYYHLVKFLMNFISQVVKTNEDFCHLLKSYAVYSHTMACDCLAGDNVNRLGQIAAELLLRGLLWM